MRSFKTLVLFSIFYTTTVFSQIQPILKHNEQKFSHLRYSYSYSQNTHYGELLYGLFDNSGVDAFIWLHGQTIQDHKVNYEVGGGFTFTKKNFLLYDHNFISTGLALQYDQDGGHKRFILMIASSAANSIYNDRYVVSFGGGKPYFLMESFLKYRPIGIGIIGESELGFGAQISLDIYKFQVRYQQFKEDARIVLIANL